MGGGVQVSSVCRLLSSEYLPGTGTGVGGGEG